MDRLLHSCCEGTPLYERVKGHWFRVRDVRCPAPGAVVTSYVRSTLISVASCSSIGLAAVSCDAQQPAFGFAAERRIECAIRNSIMQPRGTSSRANRVEAIGNSLPQPPPAPLALRLGLVRPRNSFREGRDRKSNLGWK
eukprot:2784021-Prymnesium_polylepis.1